MKIGVDIDGTIARIMDVLLPKINCKYQVELAVDDITDYWCVRTPVGEIDLWREAVSALNDGVFLQGIPAEVDATGVIRALRKRGHSIVIATSREPNTMVNTHLWLARNGFEFDALWYTNRKHEIGLDVLIDDSGDTVYEFLLTGRALLVDRPWNRVFDLPRVTDWGEVFDRVRQLEGAR